MSSIPDVQKAWVIVRKGLPEKALELKTDFAVPKKLAHGEVLVRVQAASLNPVGWKLMVWLPSIFQKLPRVVEHDLAGEIVDANGTEFSNGDQVFGHIPVDMGLNTRQGTLAQYTRMPAECLIARPSNISPVGASGIALAGLTAYQALFDIGKLEAGQTVFINGGSSSVGALAIQLAKAAGANVVATASAKNEQLVKRMGADEFIDYTKVDLPKYLVEKAPSPKYHIVFDAVGLIDPSLYTHSEAYLAPNGVFISSGPLPKLEKGWFAEAGNLFRTFSAMLLPRWLGGTRRRYAVILTNNKKADLEVLHKHLAEGKLTPLVDSVYDFDDVVKAYERIMTTKATGKVVVKVDPTVD